MGVLMEKEMDFQKGVLCWNLGLMVQDRWVTGKMKETVIQAPLAMLCLLQLLRIYIPSTEGHLFLYPSVI